MRVIGSTSAERLVHQNDSRVQDQGASDRDRCRMPPESQGTSPESTAKSRPTSAIRAAVHAHIVLVAAHPGIPAERDVVKDGSMVKAGVILENHAAVGRRDRSRLPPSRAPGRKSVDAAGRSPAISRRIVLLPLPLGPRIQMNSPLPTRSSTTKSHVANRRELVRSPHIESSWLRRETRRRGSRTSPG